MNSTYYHGSASVFALTFPVFHPLFGLPNVHLPHSHPFFRPGTCVIGPHISLYIVMSKTVHSLINIVMKTQTLPFASSIADLLNGMCPLGNISYFPLACYSLYHLDVSTSHSPVGFPLGMSSRTLYTSLIARLLEHLMLLHLDRKVIVPRSEGI